MSSHVLRSTIINAVGLDFRVRNENGYYPHDYGRWQNK